jgi:hypothetical protein
VVKRRKNGDPRRFIPAIELCTSSVIYRIDLLSGERKEVKLGRGGGGGGNSLGMKTYVRER